MFELLFVHPVWAYRAGKLAFASAWPRWLLLLLIVAAIAVVVATLWRRRFLGLPRLLLLGGLQVALAALVIAMVWRPVLNVERVRDRQNVLAVVLDTSASMAHSDDAIDGQSRLQNALDALKAGPLDSMAETFELRYFTLGSSLSPLESLEALPPPAAQTRIGDALLNVMQTAGSVPLAGIVLVSDGAENARSLSEANLRTLASFGVPVHAVGVGPENIDNDLELTSVELPASVAPGAIVTADVNLRHSARAATTTRLRVYDSDALLAARELKLDPSVGAEGVTRVRVEFPAGAAGVRDLRFVLDPLPDERNQINNERRHVLNVPARRRNILYLEGEPRWEYKFIRRAVEGERSLRLVSVVRTTQNKLYRQGVSGPDELAEGLPLTAKELFAYDAIIIGSYEAPAFTHAQHELLKEFVDRRGGSILFLAGRNGLGDGGWGSSPVAQVLPIHLPAKRGDDFLQASVYAQLTDYGLEAPALRFDADRAKNAEQWGGLPPLANYQRLGSLRPGAVVLLEGAIQSDADRAEGRRTARQTLPLLVWQRYGRGSAFVLATASTQRWQMSLPSEDQRHEIFWRQLLYALADHAPEAARIDTDRLVYLDDKSVHIDAELRDENYEALAPKSGAQSSVAEVTITTDQGATVTLPMQPAVADSSPQGRLTAEFEAEAPGLYQVELTARGGDDRILTASTAFRRDDNVVEHFGLRQHRATLERIAAETSGRYWRLDELAALGAAIPYTKSGIVERQMLDLWNLPVVFLLLLALKVGEWLLRLKWGTL